MKPPVMTVLPSLLNGLEGHDRVLCISAWSRPSIAGQAIDSLALVSHDGMIGKGTENGHDTEAVTRCLCRSGPPLARRHDRQRHRVTASVSCPFSAERARQATRPAWRIFRPETKERQRGGQAR